jgi:hypothetical protein
MGVVFLVEAKESLTPPEILLDFVKSLGRQFCTLVRITKVHESRTVLILSSAALWTVPELLFESKKLIPALQHLITE